VAGSHSQPAGTPKEVIRVGDDKKCWYDKFKEKAKQEEIPAPKVIIVPMTDPNPGLPKR
jgi:hypothetical protein